MSAYSFLRRLQTRGRWRWPALLSLSLLSCWFSITGVKDGTWTLILQYRRGSIEYLIWILPIAAITWGRLSAWVRITLLVAALIAAVFVNQQYFLTYEYKKLLLP